MLFHFFFSNFSNSELSLDPKLWVHPAKDHDPPYQNESFTPRLTPKRGQGLWVRSQVSLFGDTRLERNRKPRMDTSLANLKWDTCCTHYVKMHIIRTNDLVKKHSIIINGYWRMPDSTKWLRSYYFHWEYFPSCTAYFTLKDAVFVSTLKLFFYVESFTI